jgi:hypothetical protein
VLGLIFLAGDNLFRLNVLVRVDSIIIFGWTLGSLVGGVGQVVVFIGVLLLEVIDLGSIVFEQVHLGLSVLVGGRDGSLVEVVGDGGE